MSVQALKIVDEVIAEFDEGTHGEYQGALVALKKKLTDRLIEETIEQEEPDFDLEKDDDIPDEQPGDLSTF